jgi:hypothetical protein
VIAFLVLLVLVLLVATQNRRQGPRRRVRGDECPKDASPGAEITSMVERSEHWQPLARQMRLEGSNSQLRLIDVVVPAHERDRPILWACLAAARRYVVNVGRVICVSAVRFPEIDAAGAEWLCEKPPNCYPFTFQDVEAELLDGATDVPNTQKRVGWYFQQLIKLLAPLCIPSISEKVLVLDADAVFQREVSFFDGTCAFYAYHHEYHNPYFVHMKRLDRSFRRSMNYSAICHHMLLERDLVEDLCELVSRNHHGTPFWRVFLRATDPDERPRSAASEYELYLTFVRTKHPLRAKLRPLHIVDVSHIDNPPKDCDLIACHYYQRNK